MYVLDTNVLVAAFRSRNGASFVLLNALAEGRLPACASEALFLEYRDVLGRDRHLRRFWASPEEVQVVLGVLAARLQPVTIHFSWRPQLPDPADEMLLECVVNGMASGIVTFDRKDIEAGARRFGIPVLTPGRLVRSLGLTGDEAP